MNPILLLVLAVASYLLGSVPAGYLVGRMKGIDLRRHGSGNVGATNVVRVIGTGYGVAVFAFDFLKGFVPACWLAPLALAPGAGAWTRDAAALALGVAALLGHVFPIWLRFQGGKGVATSAGFCAGLCWPAIAIAVAIWYAVLRFSRYVSVASMTAAVAFPLAFVAWVGPERAFGERRLVTVLSVVLAVLIVYLHRANIGRLLRGEELRAGTRPGEKA